jgi:two-component system chemotaxis response regulator CheY
MTISRGMFRRCHPSRAAGTLGQATMSSARGRRPVPRSRHGAVPRLMRAMADRCRQRITAEMRWMKILVVDDYRTMRRVIQNLLNRLGYDDVAEAADGASALAALRADRIGLVLCDWNMQPMTGLQLLREIRSDRALAGTPFIMVLANDRRDDITALKEAGASGYIMKPFNAETLQGKIKAVL